MLRKTGMCLTQRLLVTEELEVIKLDIIEAFPDEIEELDKDKHFVEPAWGVKIKEPRCVSGGSTGHAEEGRKRNHTVGHAKVKFISGGL